MSGKQSITMLSLFVLLALACYAVEGTTNLLCLKAPKLCEEDCKCNHGATRGHCNHRHECICGGRRTSPAHCFLPIPSAQCQHTLLDSHYCKLDCILEHGGKGGSCRRDLKACRCTY